jgi:hypothetical protein
MRYGASKYLEKICLIRRKKIVKKYVSFNAK